MNSCTLSGRISQLYFDVVDGVQPFLAFLMRVSGPRVEGHSTARVVVYGEQAEMLYPLLHNGMHIELEARFRLRQRENGYPVYEFVARRVEVPFKSSAKAGAANED